MCSVWMIGDFAKGEGTKGGTEHIFEAVGVDGVVAWVGLSSFR